MAGLEGQPKVADCAEPGFELDRVVFDDGKVRVLGWWYGVRGRRFIRPSLTAIGTASRARALAELEHKPWAPEDGRQWLAEFAWGSQLDELEGFELAVAPDLAVRIPLPAAPLPTKKGAPARGRSDDKTLDKPGRPARRSTSRRKRAIQPQRSASGEDVSSPERLHLTRAEQRLARALAERDAAVADRDRVAADARRVDQERDQALRDRNAALGIRDGAEAERGALSRQYRALVAERDELTEARDQARAERNGLLAQYAKFRPERQRLVRERDKAIALNERIASERDRCRDERDEAARERERLIEELARIEHDAAPAETRRPAHVAPAAELDGGSRDNRPIVKSEPRDAEARPQRTRDRQSPRAVAELHISRVLARVVALAAVLAAVATVIAIVLSR